ncbi:hypothetical protein [Denitrobaculum tricleocarpae]|uniref:Uncharacterized protein n=1 Tax=Denitrobaculum tricleocarpae TaxID=2591009 RepID=A0A545U2J1_9PROT|nr:hypothetical protein [Denitrobaculum tricleocarpae]TQV83691.1 hypothetical protein FKG95_03645 [Denitrobaculum tricleocarpae]
MQLSMTPFLLAIELGFCFFLTWHGHRREPGIGSLRPAYVFFVWLSLYAVTTSLLGYHGWYLREEVLRLLPGFWLQLVTVAAAVIPVLVSSALRQDLRQIVDATPWQWFAWFHALRIAALGTAVKTMTGEFPLYFEVFVGIPDLLFGISALWIAVLAGRGGISRRGFLLWNLVGVLVIVPSAPILLQLGLPGPFHVFTDLPDARAVYSYPMSIAPMIGVPLFVLVNLCVAWRLWERGRSERRAALSRPT